MITWLEPSPASLLTTLSQSAIAVTKHGVLPSSTVAAGLGLLSHWLYFIRGEHHRRALLLCKLLLGVPVASCLILVLLRQWQLSHAVRLTASMVAAYLAALWTSMLTYRAFFHPLHRFPGPRGAKTSKLYHVVHLIFGQMDNFHRLAAWHQAYGDFVRIGKAGRLLILLFRPCAPGRRWSLGCRRSHDDRCQSRTSVLFSSSCRDMSPPRILRRASLAELLISPVLANGVSQVLPSSPLHRQTPQAPSLARAHPVSGRRGMKTMRASRSRC